MKSAAILSAIRQAQTLNDWQSLPLPRYLEQISRIPAGSPDDLKERLTDLTVVGEALIAAGTKQEPGPVRSAITALEDLTRSVWIRLYLDSRDWDVLQWLVRSQGTLTQDELRRRIPGNIVSLGTCLSILEELQLIEVVSSLGGNAYRITPDGADLVAGRRSLIPL